MKVCSVCSAIVSASHACTRSDCPNHASGVTDALLSNLEPGFTGKADHIIQSSLDSVSDATREAARKAFFSIVAFLAMVVFAVVLFFDNQQETPDIKNLQNEIVATDTASDAQVDASAAGATAAAAVDAAAEENNVETLRIEAASLHAECQSGNTTSCDREAQLSRKLKDSGMCLREVTRYIVDWRKC